MDRFCELCFMMVYVVLSCLFLVALWSPARRADLLAIMFVVFYLFPKCVLVNIRIKGEVCTLRLI